MNYLQQLPIRYDYYLAQSELWAMLFKIEQLSDQQTVLEICSGWSPKIGLALCRQNFAGNLILHDSQLEALQTNRSLVEPMSPKCAITFWQGDVVQDVGPSADIIAMNHVLDDILLFSVLDTVSDSPYLNPIVLKKLWEQHQVELNSNIVSLAQKLALNLATQLQPNGKIFLRQYVGYQEKLHHLDVAINLTQKLHLKLDEQLYQQGLHPIEKSKQLTNAFFDSLQIWQKTA